MRASLRRAWPLELAVACRRAGRGQASGQGCPFDRLAPAHDLPPAEALAGAEDGRELAGMRLLEPDACVSCGLLLCSGERQARVVRRVDAAGQAAHLRVMAVLEVQAALDAG